ncbi:hypothetical protein F2Q68_00019172 [Brassica cretica]|uniref:Uncharacterized protein n=1 Tax=Brassica cretica TaxID=69181 RepID=A0A8S9FU60_BRACR|nr:hypothetical protein F2Q68_00019172 [Brassica cretica]
MIAAGAKSMLGLSIASPKGVSDGNSRSVGVLRACVSMEGSQTMSHNKNGSIPELKAVNGHTVGSVESVFGNMLGAMRTQRWVVP